MQRNLRPQLLLCLVMVFFIGGNPTTAWCDQQSRDDSGGDARRTTSTNARGPDIYLMKTDTQGSSSGPSEDETTIPRRWWIPAILSFAVFGVGALRFLAVGLLEVVSPETTKALWSRLSTHRTLVVEGTLFMVAGALCLASFAVVLYRDEFRTLDLPDVAVVLCALGLLCLSGLHRLLCPGFYSKKRANLAKMSDLYTRVHGVLYMGAASVIIVPAALFITWIARLDGK